MPGAQSFSPEIRRRNRATLGTFIALAVILALTPLIVRLTTPRIPTLSVSARELFPDKAGVESGVTLYGRADSPLTGAVAAMLARYRSAASILCPDTPQAVEIALLDDEVQIRQVWIQVFGRDDRRRGVRGVGRAAFVLYDARPAVDLDVHAQAAEVAHLFGRALLEQQLQERLRLVPESYAMLAGEMMAVALMPDLAEEAWRDYARLRADQPALTEKAWLRAFDGDPSAAARLTTRLIAAEFITSRRSTDFIALIRDGYEMETAFRAVASGLVTEAGRTADAPPQSVPGTSVDAMIERIEAKLTARAPGSGTGGG